MKLSRLKSIVNQILRNALSGNQGYMIDPFFHFTPEFEIIIDLKTGVFTPNLESDDVMKYYNEIVDWFHIVLPKEGIPIEIIDNAILKLSPQGKKCIIEAQGRKFSSFQKYK